MNYLTVRSLICQAKSEFYIDPRDGGFNLLDADTRAAMGPRFGHDFNQARAYPSTEATEFV